MDYGSAYCGGIAMRSLLLGLALSSAVFLVPGQAEAHGEGVLTFTATTSRGYVDVDYGGLEIEAGVSGTFDFNLFSDSGRSEQLEYHDVWVRIVRQDGSSQGNTIFAGPISDQEYGPQGFLYVFPKGGDYTLFVRYNREEGIGKDEILAEFPLNVLRSAEEERFTFSLEFMLGVLAGLMGTVIVCLPFLMRRPKA